MFEMYGKGQRKNGRVSQGVKNLYSGHKDRQCQCLPRRALSDIPMGIMNIMQYPNQGHIKYEKVSTLTNWVSNILFWMWCTKIASILPSFCSRIECRTEKEKYWFPAPWQGELS